MGDPCAWLAGDSYYALINRRFPEGRGDGAFLFRSNDLAHWDHAGLFYTSDRRWTDSREDCAVPDFFPIGHEHMPPARKPGFRLGNEAPPDVQ